MNYLSLLPPLEKEVIEPQMRKYFYIVVETSFPKIFPICKHKPQYVCCGSQIILILKAKN